MRRLTLSRITTTKNLLIKVTRSEVLLKIQVCQVETGSKTESPLPKRLLLSSLHSLDT